MDFVSVVYELTQNVPDKELYGLTSQLRRAATSIPLSIAEGSGAGSDTEFKRFLNIALRSDYELMCGAEVAHRLKYCTDAQKNHIIALSDELAAMITGLKKKLYS